MRVFAIMMTSAVTHAAAVPEQKCMSMITIISMNVKEKKNLKSFMKDIRGDFYDADTA